MTERYDVAWRGYGPTIEPHFCRSDDCYGSNPDHGVSFEDAKEHLVGVLKSQAEWWGSVTEAEYFSDQDTTEDVTCAP